MNNHTVGESLHAPISIVWVVWFVYTTASTYAVVVSYPGHMGGEKRPGIECLHMHNHSQKNLGICLRLEIVGKINTHTFDIFPYHWKIQPFSSRITFNSMSVEDNRHVYEAKDAFLQLPTCFSKSVHYEVLSFVCLTVNKVSWVQSGGSYAVILLVSPLVSFTIAKFNGLSVHCSVVAHFSALYVYYFRISCPCIYYCTWTIYVNVTILLKYSGNGRACASSWYQAVSLLPRGLGMRLMQ